MTEERLLSRCIKEVYIKKIFSSLYAIFYLSSSLITRTSAQQSRSRLLILHSILNDTTINIEKDLVRRCKAGERSAFQEVYRRYASTLLNSAYRIVKNREDARDILQDSFIKAFQGIESYREQSLFEAWLRRIVINTALNHLKKKRIPVVDHSEEILDSKIPLSNDDTYRPELNIEVVKAALMDLPTGYRTVVSLYLLEGYDHSEIAEILDISINTSLTQYSRGKKKLAARIKELQANGS